MSESRFRFDTLLSGLLGGLAGGLLVWSLSPSPPDVTAQPDATPAAAPTDIASDATPPFDEPGARPPDERIEQLEETVRSLQKSAVRQAKVDAYEEPDDAGDAKRVTLNAEDPKFRNAVRAVVDQARQEADQERQDQRDDRQDRRIASQLETLTEKLKLNDTQADQVEVVLEARAEKFREMRRGPERPATRQEWRDKMQTMQAETRTKLAEVLDEEQLTAYDEHRKEEQSGRRGRGF